MRCNRSLARTSSLIIAVVIAVFAFSSAQAGAQLSLTTLFAQNNGFAGNTFDLEVLKPGGVEVESIEVNLSSPGNTAEIEVWTRPGTSVGFESSPAGWTSQGQASVTSNGPDVPTPVPVTFSLPAGTYGVAVGSINYPTGRVVYTNGPPTLFEDSELKLTSQKGLTSPPLDSGAIADRIWNGTIHYSKLTAACKSLKADVKAAKKQKRKAQKKYKKAKKKYKKAKKSGNASKIKKTKKKKRKAKKKLNKKKKKLNKAKGAFDATCK